MSVETDRYLPNKFTFQVNTAPNAQVLDIRGELAEDFSREFDISNWGISENTVQVFGEKKNQVVMVAFNRFGSSKADCTNLAFKEFVDRMIKRLRTYSIFDAEVEVQRLGVRGQFFTPYRGTFEQLMAAFRKKFSDLTPSAMQCFGDMKVDDVAMPLYLSSENGSIHFSCGAARQDEVKEKHLQQHDEASLPEVGLLVDLDFYFSPTEKTQKFSWDAIQEKVAAHVDETWRIHERVRKLIVS